MAALSHKGHVALLAGVGLLMLATDAGSQPAANWTPWSVSRSADACGSPDEARTRAAVQQRLAGELGPAASAIRVVVRGGVVTLTGMVDGEHERDRAEKLSYVVDGVEHVENHLRVRRPPENPRGM